MISDKRALAVSSALPPHIKHPDSVRSMMLDVIVALFFPLVWGVYSFGARVLAVTFVSVVTAVASEAAFEFICKKRFSAGDLSSAVTGLLLAFLLPAGVPLYVPFLGAVFATVIVKCAFGGLGCNILNPALAGYIFVKLCFPAKLLIENDPLAALKAGDIPDVSLYDMLVGNIPGGIGEVSALLLFAGGVYLMIRGIADWRISVTFIGSVAALTLMLPNNPNALSFMGYELFSGSLFLGALFMATDPVTSPVNRMGRLIYGVLCGALTVLLRYYGGDPEGTAYAILTMNLLSGIIDRLCSPARRVRSDG